MKVIGLTGPSGSGKSTVCELFLSFGVPAIDCDGVYHRLLAEDTAMKKELAAAFGRDVLTAEGDVDRKHLARAVFGSENKEAALHTLNAITHKYIMAEIEQMVQAEKEKGASALLLDAPQLFEARADRLCDVTVAVLSDRDLCLSRIMERDGLCHEAAAARLLAQKSDDFFKARCDAVLYNNGNKEELLEDVRQILSKVGIKLS